MKIIKSIQDACRKNLPEIVAWWNGSLPQFVTARLPRAPLDGVPVFCYHLVEIGPFEADLQFLQRNGYVTVNTDQLVGYLNRSITLPSKAVMLTFDDGPRNFHDVAFPLLQKYNAKALAFIAPGLHADATVTTDTDARPMTWEEIQRVHASGLVEFHSHTLESRYVPKWPMPVPLAGCEPQIESGRRGAPLALERDLVLSQHLIETKLPATKVHQLSFPMYNGTEAAVALAKSLGFRACHWGLVRGRPVNRPGDSPFYISRISEEFLRRLPGEGRSTFIELLRGRAHRIKLGRSWRRRFAEVADPHG
jgi:peptidoglycan/xylan/chitin deacetylase (PgdA/CDA1 family)